MSKNAPTKLPQATADPKQTWNAQFSGFVNVTLSKDEKEHFATWSETVDFDERQAVHCRLGRKFTSSYDLKQQCFMALVFERDEKSPNAGKMISARGNTPMLCQWRLLYILDVIMHDQPWEGSFTTSADLW